MLESLIPPQASSTDALARLLESSQKLSCSRQANISACMSARTDSSRGKKAGTSAGRSAVHGKVERMRTFMNLINGPLIDPPPISSYTDSEAVHKPDSGTPLPLADWVRHIETLGAAGLVQEFHELRSEMPFGEFETFGMHKEKNRYGDVQCYDYNRVILNDNFRNSSDYIHGNYNCGYKQSKAYITTQGPLRSTYIDFWRMIWQERSMVIVMTTRMIERNKEKCGQYWPISARKNMRYGPFIVGVRKIVREADFDVTYLLVRNNISKEERIVCHFLYHAWPDYKVPRSPTDYLAFLRLVHKVQATMVKAQLPNWTGHVLGPPIVVHCSAGIGRTGTFLAIDVSIARLTETGCVDVADTVRKIRQQRMHSIQTPEQYIFIHLVLIEFAVYSGLYNLETLDLSGFVGDA